MRTHTTSIQIDAPAEEVLALVGDLEQLPRWAVGFAKVVEREGDGHVVTLGSGERLPIALAVDPDRGTADFDVAGVPAYTRVVPAAGGSVYTFTMLQGPDMPDDVFDGQVAALGHELRVLKGILEVSCPR
jgi:Polyketide cyclase / dehydrase and lipid transport